MASKQNYLPTWTTVTPVKPVEKKTTVTPILPPMVGSKLVAPVLPPVPVKLVTPVTPPVVKKNETPLAPVGSKVISSIVEEASSKPRSYDVNWRDFGYSGYGKLKDKKGTSYDYEVSLVPPDKDSRSYYLPYNEVKLYDKTGNPVARLEWSNTTGEILMVEVDAAARRRGIATELLRLANTVPSKYQHVLLPQHSRDRSVAGDAWAKSVGGNVPPLVGTLPGEAEARQVRIRNIAVGNLSRRGVKSPTQEQIDEELAKMNARLGR